MAVKGYVVRLPGEDRYLIVPASDGSLSGLGDGDGLGGFFDSIFNAGGKVIGIAAKGIAGAIGGKSAADKVGGFLGMGTGATRAVTAGIASGELMPGPYVAPQDRGKFLTAERRAALYGPGYGGGYGGGYGAEGLGAGLPSWVLPVGLLAAVGAGLYLTQQRKGG